MNDILLSVLLWMLPEVSESCDAVFYTAVQGISYEVAAGPDILCYRSLLPVGEELQAYERGMRNEYL